MDENRRRLPMTTTRGSAYLIVVALLVHSFSDAVHLTHVQIPEFADVREVVTLSCSYVLRSNKHLNSVKFYKDGMEFFRYSPMTDQKILNWTVDGITFDNDHPYSCNKTTCSISLDNLSSMSSGLYRCEISADAPKFAIDFTDQRMKVVGLPRQSPSIKELKNCYDVGDTIEAMCKSDASYPPTKLTWYINNELVTDDSSAELTHFVTIAMKVEDLSLRYTTTRIRFHLDEYFEAIDGRLFLMCIANIESIPSVKRQTSEVVYIRSDELNSLRLINSACRRSKFLLKLFTIINLLKVMARKL